MISLKKYALAITIWIAIIPIAILNGGLRENVLVKLGAISLPLSGIILSICIFVIALWLIPKIKNCNKIDYIIFGILWAILTNLFDLSMILKNGGSFNDLLAMYSFANGNTWSLVVLSTLTAPMIAGKVFKRAED